MPALNQLFSITNWCHRYLEEFLTEGDTVIDATAGNGHDTLFLAQHVGASGRVFSIDIQEAALTKTGTYLNRLPTQNVTLIHGDHRHITSLIPRAGHPHIKAILFNLGYLPGGDKNITTEPESTIEAITQAWSLLQCAGVLSIICYPGHPTGQEELKAVRKWLNPLPHAQISKIFLPNKPAAPFFFGVMKRAAH